LFLVCARRQHIAAMGRQPVEDSCDVLRGLPLGEDHLGHTLAQSPMMIDLGKPNIFEGKVPQALDRLVGRLPLLPDVLKKLPQVL
jgi:hypothetical protein